jgi:hypothetical protein
MKTIFLIRQLMKRCRKQKKNLHMIFIDLKKAYDKVHRNVMWWALQKHKVSTKYIMMGISLCTWSLWGWFFSASWTAFRAVRTAS